MFFKRALTWFVFLRPPAGCRRRRRHASRSNREASSHYSSLGQGIPIRSAWKPQHRIGGAIRRCPSRDERTAAPLAPEGAWNVHSAVAAAQFMPACTERRQPKRPVVVSPTCTAIADLQYSCSVFVQNGSCYCWIVKKTMIAVAGMWIRI